MVRYRHDAFMSHNSADKPAVESIAAALEAQDLSCFLDKWDILPKDQWLKILETGITESRTILIFVGTHGVGPYQQAEADAALRRQIQQRQDCVIPVLLPGASPEDIAKLSLFLQGTNALRFYDLHEPFIHRLLAGLVRGEDPNHLRQLIRERAQVPPDLLQALNHWLSGLQVEWREDECRVSEGQGQRCLGIPDLSGSPNLDSIEYLLNWKSRLTQMVGREQELKVLHDWANAGGKISIRLLIGEGGAGKTRLAFELATQLKEQGWQAGEAQGLEGNWYTGSPGTLLIIDYPEQRPQKVSALLEALGVMQTPERKLRILLLGRNGDFLEKLPQTAQSLVAPPIELSGLAVDGSASWSLFQQTWQRVHDLKHVSVPPSPMAREAFRQWQQQADVRRRPLFVLALAIRLMLDPDAKELSGQAIIRVFTQQYEVIRLKKEAKKRGIDEDSLVMLRALAAISGQLESEPLRQLIEAGTELKLDIQLPTLRQLKGTSLWAQEAIHALQPDLLAADLLHYALTELAGDQSGAWQHLGLEAAANMEEASSIFGRLIHDAQSMLGQRWPLPSLTEWTCGDVERCKKLNPVLSRDNMEHTLLPLVIAVEKVLLAHDESPQAQAHHLNNLSLHFAESGNREEALQAGRRAVQIYKRLATGNFARYAPWLAGSLNNLSTCLCESGEREEALQAVREGVEIYERLAEDNFGTYGSRLAASLNNLSLRLANNGELKAALRAIQRSVEIYKQLAADNIPVYGPDLAGSLNNMSLHLADNGEREAALRAIQQAVETYEQLAEVNFAAYGSALAASLNNLSLRLTDNGERTRSLQAMRRAVKIYEQRAVVNFLAYGPDLAMSLNNLSVALANSGKREAGLEAIRRAAKIYEQLAADNFAAHGPGLAMSLNNLAVDLANNRKREESLQTFREAVEIREQLAAGSFATYGPALATSLYNFSIRLDELGKVEEAAKTKAKLESIKQRFRDEGVDVPARLAFLFGITAPHA